MAKLNQIYIFYVRSEILTCCMGKTVVDNYNPSNIKQVTGLNISQA